MNQRFQNVQWAAEDATQMQLPPDSADVVFSNWLLMYLNDAEVSKLAADSILWVRAPVGHRGPTRTAMESAIHHYLAGVPSLVSRSLSFAC